MIGQEVSFVFELLGACLTGLVAAICMTIFELPFWKNWGIEGVAEWQVNSVIVSILIRKFSSRRVSISMSVGNALAPWSSAGHCVSSSSGPAWNSDSRVLDPNLRDCIQRCPMDNFPFSIQESLRKSRRLWNDKERISGQLSCTRCLRCLSRSSDSGNCLNISPR